MDCAHAPCQLTLELRVMLIASGQCTSEMRSKPSRKGDLAEFSGVSVFVIGSQSRGKSTPRFLRETREGASF